MTIPDYHLKFGGVELSVYQEINDTIANTVLTDEYLTLRTHRVTWVVEKHLQYALDNILTKVGRSDLMHALYTIVKELTINGCKANQKRIFFEENDLNIEDESQYSEGVKQFTSIFSEKMAMEYGEKSRDRGFYVLVDFWYNRHGIRIEVINNTPAASQEEKLMVEKMERSKGYRDIAEFYMDDANIHDSEGAGLGIALIVILLNGENISPDLFKMYFEKKRTLARLEIPFSDDFEFKEKVPAIASGKSG